MSSTPLRLPELSEVKLPENATGPSASKPVTRKAYGVPACKELPPDMQVGSSPLGPSDMILPFVCTGAGKIACAGTGLWLSATCTANCAVAFVVGVPAMTPVGLKVIPEGKGPLPGARDHV